MVSPEMIYYTSSGCQEWQFSGRLNLRRNNKDYNLMLSIFRKVSSRELEEPHKTTIITLKLQIQLMLMVYLRFLRCNEVYWIRWS